MTQDGSWHVTDNVLRIKKWAEVSSSMYMFPPKPLDVDLSLECKILVRFSVFLWSEPFPECLHHNVRVATAQVIIYWEREQVGGISCDNWYL